MRQRIHPITLAVALLLGGCGTFGSALINSLAYTAGVASEWAVKSYPERRIAFDLAEQTLTIYLAEDTLTMDKLIGLLSSAGLDESGWAGPNGDLYLKAGLVVWQLASSVNHVIANNKYVLLFGTEIRDGFRRGLAATEPVVAKNTIRAMTPSTVPYKPRDHMGKRVVHTGGLF